MRVLLITSTVSEKSGWGRHSAAIAKAIRAQGVEVEVVADNAPLTLARFAKNCMTARTKAKKADVVHAIDGWPYGVYALAAVLGTGKKLFINGIGTYSVAPLYHFGKSFLLKKAYARASAVFSISEYTKHELASAGVEEKKIQVIHYGAPSFEPLSADRKKELASRLGITGVAQPVVLTVGAIKNRKGQLDTLGAVDILKNTHPNILYVLAGSGNDKRYLREVEEYVSTHGLSRNAMVLQEIDDEVLTFLYDRCTVFALNSVNDETHHHFEGFGAAILEANTFGKPAVGSRGCGIEDAIKDGYSGLLAAQRDSRDIASKIEAVLAEYDSFSTSTKIFSTDFSWEKTAGAYISFYKG